LVVALLEEAAPDGFAAQIQPLRGRKRAQIRLGAVSPCFYPTDSATRSHTSFAPASGAMRFRRGGGDERNAFAAFVVSLEYGIDGLADAIAAVPLPPSFHD
jgi:hypothetical protein